MIVTCATPNYEGWLRLMLRSYGKSNPGGKARIYLVNYQENPFQDDKEFFKYSTVCLESPVYPDNKLRALMKLKLTLLLYELVLNPINMFWVDADTVVLKNIQPLLDKLNDYDLAVLQREGAPDQRKVAAGVFGVSPRIIPNLAKWARSAWNFVPTSIKDGGWYSDQLALWEMSKEVKTYGMNDNEHSIHENKDTVFLSSHRRIDELEFTVESINRA